MGGAGGANQLVVFQVEGRDYGLPLQQVGEVVRMVALTPVPDAPAWVAGVANLRGELIPIVDLRPRLGLPPTQPSLDTVFLVASTPQRTVGVLADDVVDVVEAPATASRPPDRTTTARGFVQPVSLSATAVVLILDLDRLMAGTDADYRLPAAPAPV